MESIRNVFGCSEQYIQLRAAKANKYLLFYSDRNSRIIQFLALVQLLSDTVRNAGLPFLSFHCNILGMLALSSMLIAS